MKNKLNLELIGPCSDTGAAVHVHDTIATVDMYGRVGLHRVTGIEREGKNMFSVTTKGGGRYVSSDCWLLYTKKQPKKRKIPV